MTFAGLDPTAGLQRHERDRHYSYNKPGRGGAVTVLAVFSLIAGAVELIGGLCGLAVAAFTEGAISRPPGCPASAAAC